MLTDLPYQLTSSLEQVLKDVKLLHPGINTADILTAFIAAIEEQMVLDGKGVVLKLVCEEVRKYMTTREDCIVLSLIDDSATELPEKLQKDSLLISFQATDDLGVHGGLGAQAV